MYPPLAAMMITGSEPWIAMFPTLLAAVYALGWIMVHSNPLPKSTAPQYEPPEGISPAVARFIVTGGSDGTTIAAALANLAACGIVRIETKGSQYVVKLIDATSEVWPEEAALLQHVLGLELPVRNYRKGQVSTVEGARGDAAGGQGTAVAASPAMVQAVLDTEARGTIHSTLDAMQETMRKNLGDVYFTWNTNWGGTGFVVTLLWTLVTAFLLQQRMTVFIAFWLFMFTSIAGVVIGAMLTSKQSNPTAGQRAQRFFVPLVFYALPGAVMYKFAFPQSHTFVLSLLVAVALNSAALVLLRAPTPEGREVLLHLSGFREFLMRVERDELERVNEPVNRAEIMNRFLPYAIALNVHEGWGDRMAAAFSNVVVER